LQCLSAIYISDTFPTESGKGMLHSMPTMSRDSPSLQNTDFIHFAFIIAHKNDEEDNDQATEGDTVRRRIGRRIGRRRERTIGWRRGRI